jgi:pyruvate/2-oxoglutarate dehydrogenase complex dihydrolipoamide acyltransferase (E2) component
MSKSKYQGKVKNLKNGTQSAATYYIVNPAGAVHECEIDYCKWRLRDSRYRLASDAEIERFKETRVQTANNPIAPPQKVEDVFVPEVPDAEANRIIKATEKARELANKHGVDLRDIKDPSGAGGDILVSDVEAYVADQE